MKISQLGKKLKWAFMCACAHTHPIMHTHLTMHMAAHSMVIS